jgi:hypothetical protein
MVKKTQEQRDGKPEAPGGSSGRNSRVKPMGASSITAGEEVTGPGTTQRMEAVVERSHLSYGVAYLADDGSSSPMIN